MWGGHDHNARHRHCLGQGELCITGARRQINDENVPLTPFGLIQELPNDAVEHRAAPDHRLVIVDQQTHRHHGDAAGLDRHNPLLIAAALHLRCLVSDAQHGGCVRPVDIGVQKSDPQAGLGEGAGQIDRDGALADAALAAAHGNHLADAGDRLAFRRLTMAGLANAPLAWRLADLDLHVVNAIERHQSAPCFGHDAVSLALGEAWKAEAKHSPRRGDADLFDPAELQGRFATAGIFDLLEGLVGLLDRGHPFHQGKPDPRGAARDSP